MDMVQDIHPSYDWYQLFFETSDTGHAGAARRRTYVIASLRDVTTCKMDPFDMHAAVVKKTSVIQTRPSDYCLGDYLEVHLDAMQLANRRQLQWSPPPPGSEMDLRGLLLPREQTALQVYEAEYMRRYGVPASTDKDLVVFLGSDPTVSLTWSAVSKAIPTQTTGARSGKFWVPALRRWLVGRERLAAMGWPVTDAAAGAMGCPIIPTRDVMRCSLLAGNAMHFNTVALAQLLALSCFGPL